ncbi:MAG: phosphatase PAP2 family protein [Gammaproteobacteria bacterium]|nr:phosphatase PAP2 family protein [Gammaproteobacteria bacterium]
MASTTDRTRLARAVDWELSLCFRINHAFSQQLTQRLFVFISRLGDGVFWYNLIIALPFIYGISALAVCLRMGFVSLTGLAIYKLIKSFTSRERPYRKHGAIKLGTHPLDHYSFPSGHTLHAVGFTATAMVSYPELGWLLVPFSALVAMSRVVLGLHYPTDVLAGASIGAGLAYLSTVLF